MIKWLNDMLFKEVPFGERLINILIVAFAAFFVFGWGWLLIDFAAVTLLDITKWVLKRTGYYSTQTEARILLLEERLESIFQKPHAVISKLYNKTNKKAKLMLIKGISISMILFAIGIALSFYFGGNIYHEFFFMIKGRTGYGYITRAEEFEEGEGFFYAYEYTFTTSRREIINSHGNETGRLPEFLDNANTSHLKIEVEYIPETPQINRVRNLKERDNTTFGFWGRKILLWSLFLVPFGAMGIGNIKHAIKEYANSVKT